LLYKLKQLKHLNHNDGHKGIVTHFIHSEDLVILHSEPYIHPLFRTRIAGKCLTDFFSCPFQIASIMKAIEFAKLGNSFCFEHCITHDNIVRVSCAWFHPCKSKSGDINIIKYEEAWYDQFEVPQTPALNLKK